MPLLLLRISPSAFEFETSMTQIVSKTYLDLVLHNTLVFPWLCLIREHSRGAFILFLNLIRVPISSDKALSTIQQSNSAPVLRVVCKARRYCLLASWDSKYSLGIDQSNLMCSMHCRLGAMACTFHAHNLIRKNPPNLRCSSSKRPQRQICGHERNE